MSAPWIDAALGKPYRAGATGPDAFDCWGVVRGFLRDRGIDATTHVSGWKFLGCAVTDARRVGDVVLTDGPDGRQGVAVCVSVSPMRFSTALPDAGVVIVPSRALAGSVQAAYRWAKGKSE